MFGFLLRGFVFVSVVTTYTISMWNLISSHFIREFNSYISSQKIVVNSSLLNQDDVFNKTLPCTTANYFANILGVYLHANQCKAVYDSK